MTLHLRGFMRGPGNYPAARMIKKNKTWRRNLKTERGDTEGVGPQL